MSPSKMPDDGHCEDAGGKFITKKGCFTKLISKKPFCWNVWEKQWSNGLQIWIWAKLHFIMLHYWERLFPLKEKKKLFADSGDKFFSFKWLNFLPIFHEEAIQNINGRSICTYHVQILVMNTAALTKSFLFIPILFNIFSEEKKKLYHEILHHIVHMAIIK